LVLADAIKLIRSTILQIQKIWFHIGSTHQSSYVLYYYNEENPPVLWWEIGGHPNTNKLTRLLIETGHLSLV
jgi:hypothetical protein